STLDLAALDLEALVPKEQLPPALQPADLDAAGVAQFVGRLTASNLLSAPFQAGNLNLNGNVRLQNAAFNDLAFEPTLEGPVALVAGATSGINLQGQRDRVSVSLLPCSGGSCLAPYYIERLLLRNDSQSQPLVVQAVGTPARLDATIQNFPLDTIPLQPAQTAGIPDLLEGQLAAQLAVNFPDLTTNGAVQVAGLRLGELVAQQFSSRFAYQNQQLQLVDGSLLQAQNQVAFSGQYDLNSTAIAAQVDLTQGQVQPLLAIVDALNRELGRASDPNLGDAVDVPGQTVGAPGEPILHQLEVFQQIRDQVAAASPGSGAVPGLPNINQLQGALTGQVTVGGALNSGVQADFKVRGQNLQWDTFENVSLIADGRLTGQPLASEPSYRLALSPLRIEADTAKLTLAGTVGQGRQSARLQVNDVPLAKLQAFLNLPVELEGDLDANATLAGQFDNPQFEGLVRLADAKLNGTPVQEGQVDFRLAQARLGFDGSLLVNGPEPVKLQGSVPIALPFLAVQPESDQLAIQASVKNEGLQLINVLNSEVVWVNGSADVELDLRGTLQKPQLSGFANFNNATLKAAQLDSPLTNFTGQVRLEGDRIRVVGLQGNIAEGQVMARGVIPILEPLNTADADSSQPLEVATSILKVDIKDLYKGDVQAKLAINGTALSPEVGGQVNLTRGHILISPQESTAASPGANGLPPAVPTSNQPQRIGLELIKQPFSFQPKVDNLVAMLAEQRITVGPFARISAAQGQLTLNGPIDNLQTSGIVRLPKGRVDLLSAGFLLDQGYNNVAQFVPGQGFDPNLDLRLETTVIDAVLPPTRLQNNPSEIRDPSSLEFGSAESIQVVATVKGPASQLNDPSARIVQLSSFPGRSQAELVALLGGSVLGTSLVQGVAGGVANFLLGDLQDLLGGRIDFQIVPVPQTSDEVRGVTGALSLGADIGVRLTNRFVMSVIVPLTNNQNPLFSVRYRINNNLRLQGSTDFDEETRGGVFFDTRF
ncbi:MAG: translocation/assembly module TamB domain-containing protein, partial [Cyanobacteria bacterium P01_H01_bin.121]